MPKRRSLEEEQEVIGQIFDFIFKEAKKKPEKRKPIKVSGLNGKGLFVILNVGTFMAIHHKAIHSYIKSLDSR